jgi:hypothetical protein
MHASLANDGFLADSFRSYFTPTNGATRVHCLPNHKAPFNSINEKLKCGGHAGARAKPGASFDTRKRLSLTRENAKPGAFL